jgi:hypothetical protein
MTLRTAGSIKENPKGSLAILPHEGVSVTLGRWSRDEGSRLTRGGSGGFTRRNQTPAAAPWPAARRSSQSSTPVHYLTRDQYQSMVKLKAISPDKEMEAKTARDNRAAQKGGRPISCSQWRHKKQLANKLRAPSSSQDHAKAGKVAYGGRGMTYASN